VESLISNAPPNRDGRKDEAPSQLQVFQN